ncbi:serine/threonine-protein kinase [Rhodovulum sp. DZ06]|uniref:serine/threonine-protein kinase n=1 Tax=Rhodovulum sp. DZ06 TaxID=3425126 RepID=UPI003D325712
MTEAEQGALKPGDILNHTFLIKSLLGVGGTGEVYLADNQAQGSEVAIKVLKREFAADERFVQFMQREASVLDSIVDPSVVRYYGLQKTAEFGGLVFLVTEFIRGPSLADMMESGPVPADALVHVARRAAEGLRAAHSRGAFHRDLSPDNILLRDGDPQQAVLIDFGIAKDIDSGGKTVAQGGFLGKYEYAPIDQIHGQVDARSDIYSLGMTLLAAFHGRHPRFDGYDAMLKAKASVPPLDAAPEPLRGLIEKMVQPSPADRFQGAEEVLAAIAAPGAGMDAPAPAGDAAPLFDAPESQPGMPRTGAAAPKKGAPVSKTQGKSGPKPKQPEESGGAGGVVGLVAAIAVLCAMGGAAWYFTKGPDLPVAAPYRVVAEDPGEGPGTASGDAPTEAIAAELRATLSRAVDGGPAEVRVALGVPSEQWPTAVSRLARAAGELDSFKLQVADTRALLTGEAADEAVKAEVSRLAADAARIAGLSLDARITAPEKRLTAAELDAAAEGVADCGPLAFTGGSGAGFGPRDAVTVTGKISSDTRAAALRRALEGKADGRELTMQLQVLNAPICAFEEVLPPELDGDVTVRMSWGEDPRFPGRRTGPNPSGVFLDGENPVIDIVVPADMQGRLHVYQVNPHGKVYHTFPPRQAPENRLELVQPIAVDGERVIRVQHSVAEIWDEPDDTPMKVGIVTEPFGLGMVLAVVTEGEAISSVVPNEESVAAAVQDLAAAVGASPPGSMVTGRMLVETKPR